MAWLYKCFAVSWVLFGLWTVVKPRALAGRMIRKGSRMLRVVLTGLGLYLSGTLIAVGRHLEQPYKAILLVIAVVGCFKAVSMLRSSAAKKLGSIAQGMPVMVLRIGGVLYILLGAWMYHRAGHPDAPEAAPTEATVPSHTTPP
jgi:hypothetical protein